ncbi:hypothetical protein SAMD00019534_069880 [Acytostelium subglobosum LB1]|uniref:hypothetical protein n=1 Tax=Acytostelium subglobosum LB1 TaxID=1410327 RepID=UPI0006448283|nr:hypothetical protein SAMD00019534_069880 [Acytostelium subglobosum LB1]GAM23813.1 hypothetical protein SAMD00019534_069880 [Acytostelium subglobosum LB1]|eukprot:XP_012753554.1 hypothetical protein SAMD00019534_069880 [Acytostelium subglobosum LB1]
MQNTSFENLPTPSVLVDEDVVIRNCKRMIERAQQLGVNIRPHMKTHKTIEIGKYQTDGLQLKKIIVSTLAEARFFAKSGQFRDILYAIPIAPNKLHDAALIHASIDALHLMVDHPDHIRALIDFRKTNPTLLANKKWSVFVKIDCGYHRAGADPALPSTIALVRSIVQEHVQHFDFQGIYSHSGHSYRQQTPAEIAKIAISEATVTGDFGKKLVQAGLPCPNVSIGSTPVCCHLPDNLRELGVTEVHPGNYVFYDMMQVELGNCTLDDVAVSVVGRVISVYPERNELLIDAGSLALSSDPGCTHLVGRQPGYGIVADAPHLRVVGVTQEIGKIQSSDPTKTIDFSAYPIGKVVRVFPNHSCLTAAMFSNYQVSDKSGCIHQTWIPDKHW